MRKITSIDLKKLRKPSRYSHKYDNGILLIIGGSRKYHGAPWYSVDAAAKIVDLVYYSSVPENNKLMKKIKCNSPAFITIPRSEIVQVVREADCVLIGPGFDISQENKNLINNLLRKFLRKKFVLDAAALKMINLKLLNQNIILTPHAREFQTLFHKPANAENARKMAKKFNCLILLKGVKDIVCLPQKCQYNLTGNQGMTKGGTGDVLAGLVAGLACKNDLFLAACAGAYLNGLAGDRLKKRFGYYYSAGDLFTEFQKIIK